VQKKSLFLEREYKTTDGPKGASKNDIALIAYAQSNDKIVVTLESEQKQKPKEKSTYKIPLICAEQNVKCINFIEMLAGLSINC
jgi:predicted nuclease of predicted toxin-antitoxin system